MDVHGLSFLFSRAVGGVRPSGIFCEVADPKVHLTKYGFGYVAAWSFRKQIVKFALAKLGPCIRTRSQTYWIPVMYTWDRFGKYDEADHARASSR
eukprot:SAG22_NODE_116_length_19306_cov_247.696517_4_plen_95_part_00